MSTKTELEWRLVAKDTASRDVRKVRNAFNNLKKDAAALKKVLKNVLTVSAVGAGAGVGLAYVLRQTALEMDKLAKSSDRLGVGAESLASFRLAAELSGVEINTLELSLQRMVRRIGDASRGFGESQKAFKELGLDARELAQLRPEEQFIRIKSALEEIESVNRRLSLGAQIFDSEGIKTLQISIDTLRQSTEEARRSGLAVSATELDRIEEANDALTRMGAAWTGIKQTIAVELAPEVKAVADEFRGFLLDIEKQDIREAVYDIADAFAAVRDSIITVDDKFSIFWEWMNTPLWGEDPDAFNRMMRVASRLNQIGKDEATAAERAEQRRERRLAQEKAITEEIEQRAALAREVARDWSKFREDGRDGYGRTADFYDTEPNWFIGMDPQAPDRFRARNTDREPVLAAFRAARDRLSGLRDSAAEIVSDGNLKLAAAHWEQFKKSFGFGSDGKAEEPVDTFNYTLERIGDSIRYNIVDAIDAAIDGAASLQDVMRSLGRDIARILLNRALVNAIGTTAGGGSGLIGWLNGVIGSANGNVFSGGDVVPFARGGIVNGPTVFPMARGGIGLMGEAGPEAIMPLMRGRGGKLGVEASGGGMTNLNLSISAVDAPSFVRLLNSPEGQRWFQATFGRMQQRRIA